MCVKIAKWTIQFWHRLKPREDCKQILGLARSHPGLGMLISQQLRIMSFEMPISLRITWDRVTMSARVRLIHLQHHINKLVRQPYRSPSPARISSAQLQDGRTPRPANLEPRWTTLAQDSMAKPQGMKALTTLGLRGAIICYLLNNEIDVIK